MTDTKKATASAAKAATSKVADAQETLKGASSAISTSATAYVTGVSDVVKAIYGIGQEIAQETVEHGKTSMKANCVKTLAEQQAGYVQHRIESSSVHMKTVADVANASFTKVYAPLLGLLKDRKAA